MPTLRLEITCIVKTDRQNPHERIQFVGGSGFQYSQPDAIAKIDARTHSFWTRGGGKTAEVVVSTSAQGHRYLRTSADGVLSDNLLYLPKCS